MNIKKYSKISNIQKYFNTRIFRRYAPLIQAPAGGTWCLRRVLGPSGPYPVGLGPMKTSNLVSRGHIGGGPFFEFFLSDLCSLSYEAKQASSLDQINKICISWPWIWRLTDLLRTDFLILIDFGEIFKNILQCMYKNKFWKSYFFTYIISHWDKQ